MANQTCVSQFTEWDYWAPAFRVLTNLFIHSENRYCRQHASAENWKRNRAQFLSLKDKILDIIIIQGSECNDRVMLGYGIQQRYDKRCRKHRSVVGEKWNTSWRKWHPSQLKDTEESARQSWGRRMKEDWWHCRQRTQRQQRPGWSVLCMGVEFYTEHGVLQNVVFPERDCEISSWERWAEARLWRVLNDMCPSGGDKPLPGWKHSQPWEEPCARQMSLAAGWKADRKWAGRQTALCKAQASTSWNSF